jgi:Fe-S-cluster containining protein
MLKRKKGFGFSFDAASCQECGGKCCTGESGYIFLNDKEIEIISDFMHLSVLDFRMLFLIKVDNRYSIKETYIEGSHNCIFFDTNKKNCKIYSVRPQQCRTFPFWDYYKQNKKILKDCPGAKMMEE